SSASSSVKTITTGGWPAMRREIIVLVAGMLGCFVGDDGALASDDETGCETTEGDVEETGCVGCPCDDQAPCDPGLECEDVCIPEGMALIPEGPFPRGCVDELCAEDESPLRMI